MTLHALICEGCGAPVAIATDPWMLLDDDGYPDDLDDVMEVNEGTKPRYCDDDCPTPTAPRVR